jgi:hypothetical protein
MRQRWQRTLPVGAKRTKPGSLNAAITGYYSSLEFRSLAAGTQGMRRAIVERFRHQHGDKPIGLLPQKFIAVMLSRMKPFAARLKTIRGLMQFCVEQQMCAADPTQGIKLLRAKTNGHPMIGPRTKSRSMKDGTLSVPWRVSHSHSASVPRFGAAMQSESDRSMFVMAC